MPIVTLSDMTPGQEADLFVLMTSKEELTTKNGKPYFKIGFRDGVRVDLVRAERQVRAVPLDHAEGQQAEAARLLHGLGESLRGQFHPEHPWLLPSRFSPGGRPRRAASHG